jgi:hypothetical protein
MPQNLKGWLFLAQWTMQRLALGALVALAGAAAAWSLAAAAGWAPWLRLQVNLGAATGVEAGVAIQSAIALFLIGLCFFLPTNARIMALERSHRDFRVSMDDVTRAYMAVHAADRDGAFRIGREFDGVRDRLTYLRNHADLGALEPELLELAAQMSHESRDLAQVYSDEKVARARQFLKQREEEAGLFQERVRLAQSTCHELKRWLDNVQVEEAVARSQLKRLQDDLGEMLPGLGLTLVEATEPRAVSYGIAAE